MPDKHPASRRESALLKLQQSCCRQSQTWHWLSSGWSTTLSSMAAAGLLVATLAVADPLVGMAEARTPLTLEEQVSVDLFKENTPSVVYITNLAVRSNPINHLATRTVSHATAPCC